MSSREEFDRRPRSRVSPSPPRGNPLRTREARDQHEFRHGSPPRGKIDRPERHAFTLLRRNHHDISPPRGMIERNSPMGQSYRAVEERTMRGTYEGRSPSPMSGKGSSSSSSFGNYRTPPTSPSPPPPYSSIWNGREDDRMPFNQRNNTSNQSPSSTSTRRSTSPDRSNKREYRRDAIIPAPSVFQVPARRSTITVNGPIAGRVDRSLDANDWRYIDNEIVREKIEAGFKSPLPLQNAVMAAIRERADVLLSAPKGYGRTTAWIISMLDAVMNEPKTPGVVRALVVAPLETLPTIGAQLNLLLPEDGNGKRLISASWLWQENKRDQHYRELEQRGTPLALTSSKSLLSFLANAPFDISQLEYIVFDDMDCLQEAKSEKWLNDVKSKLSFRTQLVLVSTPSKSPVEAVLWNRSGRYVEIRASYEEDIVAPRQFYCSVGNFDETVSELIKIIQGMDQVMDRPCIAVFFDSEDVASNVLNILEKNDVQRVGLLPRRPDNPERWSRVLSDFREGRVDIILAPYCAERMVDSDRLLLDVFFQFPSEKFGSYLYRLKRNGRMRAGHCITFLSVRDLEIFPRLYKDRVYRGLSVESLKEIETNLRRQMELDEERQKRSVKREELLRELSALDFADEEALGLDRRAERARGKGNATALELLLAGKL